MLYLAIALVISAAIISGAPYWAKLPQNRKPKNAAKHTDISMREIMDILKRHYGANTVGILTEVKTGQDYSFSFYTEPDVNGAWLMKIGFFNICPDYFTLDNELRLIDDMQPEKASASYSRAAVEDLLNELSNTAMAEADKQYYTDLLLEVRGKCQ